MLRFQSKQIIIAHRALLNGPNKELENQPKSIERAIEKGFAVEIDVWFVNQSWYLGHDKPTIPGMPFVTCSLLSTLFIQRNLIRLVTFSHLKKWAPFAYFHTKNVDALAQFIELNNRIFKFFSHDIDEYVLTSDCKIWAYPGKPLVPGCISVMPERAPIQGI